MKVPVLSRCKPSPALLSAVGVVLALLGAAPSAVGSARAPERGVLAVFVAKDSNIRDLNMTELRHLFTTADGIGLSDERAIPYNQASGSTERVGFDQTVLRLNPDRVTRFWTDRKIRGLGGPPHSVDSIGVLLRQVGRLKGAVGYARPTQVAGDVRVVRVEGKLPTEAGYPLQFND